MEQEATLDERSAPRLSPLTVRPPWRWAAWGVFLAVWTLGLLMREATEVRDAMVPEPAHFSAAKVAHVLGYATFAVLTAWLPLATSWRRGLLAFVLAHAALTEFLQQFTGRHASPWDVGFNVTGVLLGVALTWKCWRDIPERTS